MHNEADTLERLDRALDEADRLIMGLSLSKETKDKLTSQLYDLWTDVEEELV